MDVTLPTWWVIQLVCRLSFNFSATSEPLHHLDCLHINDNRTTIPDPSTTTTTTAPSFDHHEDVHRLYYRCLFHHDQTKPSERNADCRSTDPPLAVFANDSQPFDLEQEFPRRISLQVVDLNVDLLDNSSFSSAVWLTLPKFPNINDTFQNLHLQCNPSHFTDARILCTLQTEDDLKKKETKFSWIFLFASVFIVAGGVGNILVCLAVCLDRRLQNVTNYFLLSLAVADLLVSLFVMPLGAIQGFLGYWPLGLFWCNVYVSCDVLACSCSIMHMCCISLDRYLGIRNPLKTRHTYSTKRIVSIKIAIVWILSVCVCGSVTLLGITNPKNIMPEANLCVINNSAFFIFGSLMAFYIPMIVMSVTFCLTVRLLRKKARFLQQKPGTQQEAPTFRRLGGRFRKPPSTVELPTPLSPADNTRIPPKRSLSTPHKFYGRSSAFRFFNRGSSTSISSSQPSLLATNTRAGATETRRTVGMETVQTSATENGTESSVGRNTRLRTLRLPLNVTPSNLNLRFLANRNKRPNEGVAANSVRTEQKATKVLGMVFFTFVVCWLPFFSLNIIFVICPKPSCNVPTGFVDIALWLGYVSSTINPIIYTIFNRTFRAAFMRLLQCKCQRLSRPPRYRSVNENRNSALLAQTPSSAAAGAATVPLSLSLQGTPLVTPSSVSSFLTNIRTPANQSSQSGSFDLAESSTG
ncbi:5-hydroxytryptamine receptor 2C [Planococcus citri]|uniref:5-hydroxytryptamine receptor 2C n=1 Tax=Planococcus citri TaxID=170843 RepID=UPI0031F75975